jgi:hypothetical protein
MIKQVLGKPGSAQSQVDPALVARVIQQLGGTSGEV